jgi:di/tricarboxylate transporter
MTFEQGVVLASLAALVAGLLHGRATAGSLFGGVALLFVALGYVGVDQALAQLVNPGLVAVVLLLLLGAVLDRAQGLERALGPLLTGPYRWALLKLTLFTAALSAFLNNTAVVAALMGPLKARPAHPASRLLMPMCFAASLGGVLTLVGTSTNLLVNGLWMARDQASLGIFDLLPVGAAILVACTAAMLLTMPRLLRHDAQAPERPADYVLEAEVEPGSPLVGRSVHDGGLRRLVHLYLTEIVRDGLAIAPVEPDELLRAGDTLVFTGDVTRLDLLLRFPGLRPHGTHEDGAVLPGVDRLTEVVLTAESALLRRTLREADFRGRYDAAVVAMRRGSERLRGGLGEIPLAVGDSLMLVTGPDFETRSSAAGDFLVLRQQPVQGFAERWREVTALTAFGVAIAVSAVGLVPLVKALLLLLAGFLLLGFARPADLRRRMPFEIIVIIASALLISDVMLKTGTAGHLATALLVVAAGLGPIGALAAVLLLTWMLTELMSNNAAAALMFPVAWGVAQQLGLAPLPFVMAVLYGASCSFLTPYGYQTNLMIMAPGRYTLGDYLRCGAPVALAFCATALVAIPLVFPLH